MSLIDTCELNGANPFDYLTELLSHAEEMKSSPSEWMPCRGTSAKHWRGWHDLRLRNMIDLTWPKRINCGQA
jgi:IS66 C-terminal element